jgi:7-cyano-7-deazaguanine synthase
MTMTRAIVLLSGGMDSLVTAAIADQQCDELYFLHFSYGQRTQARELKSFHAIAQHYQCTQAKVIDYQWLSEIGGSALTDPTRKIEQNDHGIPNSYVPFRNATMLCAATAWAEVLKAEAIYIGAVQEDSSGYPDCRQSFFEAFAQVIQEGTIDARLQIQTPVLHHSKAEIVKIGMQLNAPFELSWSCYTSEDAACGKCPSCRLRLKAFAIAGLTDPISYKARS